MSQLFDRRTYGKRSHRVIVFIGGYKTNHAVYIPLYAMMRLLGYRVIAYTLDPSTVDADHISAYANQMKSVYDDVVSLIAGLPQDAKIYTMGNSLGSESALYLLKNIPAVRATYLVTGRGSIAEYIWNSPQGREYKPKYLKNGYSYESFVKELQSIEPRNDVNKIGDRSVFLAYALHDTIIPVSNTQLLIDALPGLHTYQYKRGNHLAAAVKGLGAFWRWHQFYKS